MECDLIDIGDCSECGWLAYDPIEDKNVCTLNDDRPINEIEVCNINNLLYEAEELVIEEGRKHNE